MPRFVGSNYRRNIALLMAVYIALLLVLWPLIKATSALALKAVFALLPVVPMIAALWLIARRVMDSDELQQRVHLIALSTATGVVSAVSLAVGFLSATHVIDLDGDVLVWVMPGLGLVYAATRWIIGRRYGGLGCS
jgi:amino acid transporter